MRKAIREFVSIVAASLPVPDPIYEFGSLLLPGQGEIADLRLLFPGRAYVGVDMRKGPGVDRVLDLHDIALPGESVGTALCLDTLEHVEFPHRAMAEICRVVAPGGIAVISSAMYFPIHDFPRDYWRFTPEGFRSLLGPFPDAFVGHYGAMDFPNGVLGIGFKGPAPPLDGFIAKYEEWRSRYEVVGGESGFKRMVKLITPPVLYPIFAPIYRTLKPGRT
ncbi:MAG: methyltransferase domain-containing protein [Chlamydiota bacterium]